MCSYEASFRNRCTWYNPPDFTLEEHLSGMPTKEVPLWTQASPTFMVRKDHIAIAPDGVCDVQVRLYIVRLVRSTWAG